MKVYIEVFPFEVLKKKISSPHFTVKVLKDKFLIPVPSRPGSGAGIGAFGLGYDS